MNPWVHRMFVFIRDVIAEKMFQSSQRYMIGGLGLAVEIDESMFGMYTIMDDNQAMTSRAF